MMIILAPSPPVLPSSFGALLRRARTRDSLGARIFETDLFRRARARPISLEAAILIYLRDNSILVSPATLVK